MKKLFRLLSLALLTLCLIKPTFAQATAHALSPQPSNMKLSLDLLSDTNGANLDPYIKDLVSNLRKHWLPLASEAANQPLLEQEETLIDLTIGPDGRLSAMWLENSTHNTALDKAAWNTAKAMTYLPPPAGIKDANLKLRVHFVVN
jgi:TonB family protein